jgi:hypothetical protein
MGVLVARNVSSLDQARGPVSSRADSQGTSDPPPTRAPAEKLASGNEPIKDAQRDDDETGVAEMNISWGWG